jgi:putative hydrolase of the HAD superfamily
MGKSKKDLSHFEDVIRILTKEAQRVLFIDDDPGNCERAARTGLKAIQYIDRDQFLKEMEMYCKDIVHGS